jgi:hypothetical protein
MGTAGNNLGLGKLKKSFLVLCLSGLVLVHCLGSEEVQVMKGIWYLWGLVPEPSVDMKSTDTQDPSMKCHSMS